MQIRAIQASEIEAARGLLAANGWAQRVADAEISSGYLAMLVVAQVHRGRGIGQALVKAVMGEDRGITWVLRAGREGVAPFYELLAYDE